MKKEPLNNLKLVAIVGPTASGKSELAVELARIFNGVIISADSRQIYKGMDVGTTKITSNEMQGIPHYMLSIIDPNDDFSVSAYQKSVMNLLKSIARKNLRAKTPVVPFIVGGTGLYVSAIVDGYEFSNITPDPKLRAELNSLDLKELVKDLKKIDPETMIDIKNKRRVIRALEILKAGGNPPTKTQPPFQVLKLGFGENRKRIVKQIQERVYNFDLKALIKETKKLVRLRYKFTLPAMSALGYRDVRDFINKKITEKELKQRFMRLHTQYAKRQMTWFKRDKNIKWIKDIHDAEKLVSQFLFDE